MLSIIIVLQLAGPLVGATEPTGVSEPTVEEIENLPVQSDVDSISREKELSISDKVRPSVTDSITDEESLPILTKNKKNVEDPSGNLYRTLVSVFIVFCLGGIGLWYLKRKSLMGGNAQGLMQIKVLTQYHLAPRKSLMVVRVAGESLLLGVSENQICLLKSLSLLDEDLPESNPKNFNETIAKVVTDPNIPPKNTVLKSAEFGESEEEFSFGNIKHIVENKLKGMKRW